MDAAMLGTLMDQLPLVHGGLMACLIDQWQ